MIVSAIIVIIVLLGYAANGFSGTGLFGNLLPFAFGVLVLGVFSALFILAWWKVRQRIIVKADFYPSLAAAALSLLLSWFSVQDSFAEAFGYFRTLVGGKYEAGQVTLAHQVFAAYRRHSNNQLQTMINRSAVFDAAITAAAKEYEIDRDLLFGIAATESSFVPRDSFDGGKGLFQITAVPKALTEEVSDALHEPLNLYNSMHNAMVAAATYKHYLAEMKGDLYLGLLAYNIGPKNGGLRFIMEKYGANDFVTIQPYLQQLPRDYPIRVLSYALAFKLWHSEGRLPEYSKGRNAIHIQQVGIPGLS